MVFVCAGCRSGQIGCHSVGVAAIACALVLRCVCWAVGHHSIVMNNSILLPGCLSHNSGNQTMSLCLLKFWVPPHKVSGVFILCMSAMVINKSMTPPPPFACVTFPFNHLQGTLTACSA